MVTEYGAVDLRWKSIRERAKALISIAHPDFRDNLAFEARKYGCEIKKGIKDRQHKMKGQTYHEYAVGRVVNEKGFTGKQPIFKGLTSK